MKSKTIRSVTFIPFMALRIENLSYLPIVRNLRIADSNIFLFSLQPHNKGGKTFVITFLTNK